MARQRRCSLPFQIQTNDRLYISQHLTNITTMRLAPIAFSALAMLGFLDANRQSNASPLPEGDMVEPIAPVETAAPAVPQPKAAIAPPEPIQTAPQARAIAPRPIEKAVQKAEKAATSAPSSQVTPPPAPAPEKLPPLLARQIPFWLRLLRALLLQPRQHPLQQHLLQPCGLHPVLLPGRLQRRKSLQMQ